MDKYNISFRLSWRKELNLPFRKELRTIESENIEEAISEFRNRRYDLTYPNPADLDILKIELLDKIMIEEIK